MIIEPEQSLLIAVTDKQYSEEMLYGSDIKFHNAGIPKQHLCAKTRKS